MTKPAQLSTEAKAMRSAMTAHASARYALRLYVSGSTGNSMRAISNIRKFCEEYLDGRYDLEVVDIAQYPEFAAGDQLIAAPTLIRTSPLPVRRFMGDMSRTERMLSCLDIYPAPAIASPRKHI